MNSSKKIIAADIRIDNSKIFLKMCNKEYQLAGSFIDLFFNKKFNIKNDHKKRILLYFLNNKDNLIGTITTTGKIRNIRLKNYFSKVTVCHDPKADESFDLYVTFFDLVNLHMHTLKHCIMDYWMQPSRPIFLGNDNIFFNSFWREFKKINCKFYSQYNISDINTSEKACNIFIEKKEQILSDLNDAFIKAKEQNTTLNSLSELSILITNQNKKEEEQIHCMDCINAHGSPDTFLKCWKLLSKNNIHELYLKKIRHFIIETIQDNNNIQYYKGNKEDGRPRRQHVHYKKEGKEYICSYAVESKETKDHIYYLVFKKVTKNKPTYFLKTTDDHKLGVKSHENYQSIKKYDNVLNQKCHTMNWK